MKSNKNMFVIIGIILSFIISWLVYFGLPNSEDNAGQLGSFISGIVALFGLPAIFLQIYQNSRDTKINILISRLDNISATLDTILHDTPISQEGAKPELKIRHILSQIRYNNFDGPVKQYIEFCKDKGQICHADHMHMTYIAKQYVLCLKQLAEHSSDTDANYMFYKTKFLGLGRLLREVGLADKETIDFLT